VGAALAAKHLPLLRELKQPQASALPLTYNNQMGQPLRKLRRSLPCNSSHSQLNPVAAVLFGEVERLIGAVDQ